MFDDLRELNNEITVKLERICALRAALTSFSTDYQDKVQTSPENRLEKLMCEIILLENEVDMMQDDYANLKATVTGEIFSLENEDWQDILYAHYVEFKSFGEIAKSKGWSKSKVTCKNNRALKKLKKRH